MSKNALFPLFRKPFASRSSRSVRGRISRPAVEALEGRRLLATAAISAVEQYGIPSLVAIDQSGALSYNFLTVSNGQIAWTGWTPIPGLPGGAGATAVSTGTVLVGAILRPDVFAVNSANNIYYNFENGTGSWNGWSPVGGNVGAASISTGLIPIANKPYVFMINGANNVYYSQESPDGTWTAWSPVGINVGASAISSGVIQASSSPAVYEPYVFMINGAHDVFYNVRNTKGSWSGWSPAGIGVGAASLSAVTLHNTPSVSMLNGAGSIYLNSKNTNGSWAGWSLVGLGVGPTPAVAMSAIVSDFSIYDFGLSGAGQVYSTFGNRGTWSAWQGLGSLATGVSATTISVTSDPGSAPFAFAIGTDSNVYWADQTSWATWSKWASLGAPS